MKKSLLFNAVLFAAIVTLGLVAWLKPAGNDPANKLSTQKAANIKSIEIMLGGAPSIALERDGTEWRLTAPFPARANAPQVQRLLELADARSASRFAASGLARYGLNEPAVRIKLGNQEFGFGAVNDMSREIYVLSGDGVYLLPLRYAAALPKNPLDLVSRQLFAADEAPVAFDFGSFKIEQEAKGWKLTMTSTKVPAAEAGPDDINRWVDEWRLASAVSVQAPTNRKHIGALQVILKSGKTTVIKILERGATTVVARDDGPFEYTLAAETAKRLLLPPGTIAAAPPATSAAETAPAPAQSPAK